MIVWGGNDGAGSFFGPAESTTITDSWTTSHHRRTRWRERHTAVWTGTEMIVWGEPMLSTLNTGGR